MHFISCFRLPLFLMHFFAVTKPISVTENYTSLRLQHTNTNFKKPNCLEIERYTYENHKKNVKVRKAL